MALKINVGAELTVFDPTPEIRQYCESNLTISNPKHYQLERMGKWAGDEPKMIRLYHADESGMSPIYRIPFGCLGDIWGIVKDRNAFQLSFLEHPDTEYAEAILLRDYQEPIPEAVQKKKNGIVIAPCGSGKTVAGLVSIARLKKKALWITHTIDLLNQSRAAAEKALGLKEDQIGTIASGQCGIGSHIKSEAKRS